jgi:hypothetical protein
MFIRKETYPGVKERIGGVNTRHSSVVGEQREIEKEYAFYPHENGFTSAARAFWQIEHGAHPNAITQSMQSAQHPTSLPRSFR